MTFSTFWRLATTALALSTLVSCDTINTAVHAIPLPSLPKLSSVKKIIPGMNSDDSVGSDDPKLPFDARATLGYGHTLRLEVYEGSRDVTRRFKDLVMIDKQGVAKIGDIGSARLGGRTLPEARRMIEGVFRTGGFAAAQVSVHIVSVENTPVVSVEGDVVQPTSLPLGKGITVRDAVRYAGGRPAKSQAMTLYITHEGKRHFFTSEITADAAIELEPGDIITLSTNF